MSSQPRAPSLYALLTTCLCGQCSSIGKRWQCSCGSMESRQWPGRLWPASFTVLWRWKPEKAIWVTAWPRSWRRTLCQFVFFFTLKHWSQTQFLEGQSSAQFSSNPNQTHLIQLIKVFRITRNFQAAVSWSWLKLNSAELWPSRNWVWDHCSKACNTNNMC